MAKPPAETIRAKPRAKATRTRRKTAAQKAPGKSGATAMLESMATLMATVAQEAAKADRHGTAAAPAPPPAAAPAPSPPTAAAGNGAGGGGQHASAAAGAGGYSMGSKTAKVAGGAAPIAVALAAMALPQEQPVRAPPERPALVRTIVPPGTQPGPVPRGNATPQCLGRYQIARPVHGAEDVAGRNVLVCRQSYVLSFNVDTRDPDWVMERITAANLAGPATRSNAFGPDPTLNPPRVFDATNADYLRSGFDRGHQAPAGDAKYSQQAMNDSFFFTNMAPQIGPGFNRGVWKYLEETVRGWVTCGGHSELYVITGPIYGRNPSTIGGNRVVIPREFFKIVYDPNSGHGVGFILPNAQIGSRADLQLYARSIEDIEAATGLDFFSNFDQRRQALLESDPGTAWGHTGACPGDGGD
jgi:endonuclease G